ncbi:MAG: glycosyl transferase [Mucilaginibacter sp.]|nr:glycosyl transferase [Mucilaginibacter sp.]
MQNNTTSVSICICTYNQALYLEQAVRSAFQQTLLPIEIIVSDDCSTDETPQVLKRLSEELPLLKVIRQPENLGIAKNTDACLRLAKGSFIIRLDSDDCLLPTYTQKLADLLFKYPYAGYAHAAIQEIDEKGDFLNERKLFRKPGFESGIKALKASVKGYRVAANILMFRKEALVKVNYMTGRPNFGEDYHLSAAISAAGYGNVYLNEVLAFYRVWTDKEKLRVRRKLIEIKGIQRVFDEVIEPAYKERALNLKAIRSSKTSMAYQHAVCLGWEIYNKDEKKEIADELSKFSQSLKVKIVLWMFLNGIGSRIAIMFKLKSYIKSIVKQCL